MKLAISNIAWDENNDDEIYRYLYKIGYKAIEIAPTRLVAENPYDNINISIEKVKKIKEKYNLDICSMQSIWFGRSERIFGNKEDRTQLIEYTKKAIEYAKAIGCNNLVFGSPKNRIIDNPKQIDIAYDFFYNLGEVAYKNEITIALEPNPQIYNTNFINTTRDAIDFIKMANSKGLKVNLDLGTIIWNKEDIMEILEHLEIINHIHISEPYLEKIEQRDLHSQLKKILFEKNYQRYVSIEMKNLKDVEIVKNTIDYVSEVMR